MLGVQGESFIWPAPADPGSLDARVNLALVFSVTVARTLFALDILMPTGGALGVVPTAELYEAPAGTLLASAAFTAGPAGTLTRVALGPVVLQPGITYQAQWNTDRYPATAAYGWPAATAHMFTATPGAAFKYGAPAFANTSTSTSNYHLSPVVR